MQRASSLLGSWELGVGSLFELAGDRSKAGAGAFLVGFLRRRSAQPETADAFVAHRNRKSTAQPDYFNIAAVD
jgi:hypothetical protein